MIGYLQVPLIRHGESEKRGMLWTIRYTCLSILCPQIGFPKKCAFKCGRASLFTPTGTSSSRIEDPPTIVFPDERLEDDRLTLQYNQIFHERNDQHAILPDE